MQNFLSRPSNQIEIAAKLGTERPDETWRLFGASAMNSADHLYHSFERWRYRPAAVSGLWHQVLRVFCDIRPKPISVSEPMPRRSERRITSRRARSLLYRRKVGEDKCLPPKNELQIIGFGGGVRHSMLKVRGILWSS